MSDASKTYASKPARLPFSFVQFAKCNVIVVLALPCVVILGAVIITGVKGLLIWVGAGLGLVFAVIAVQSLSAKIRRRYQDGNLCAAVVVNHDPYTVAVLTDLCNDRSGPKLAIKIVKLPLQNMAGGAPKKGDKLVAISLYHGDSGTGAWQDFSPMIANCACSDLKSIDRALKSIDPSDWQIIAQAMTSLKPTSLGLHQIQV